MAYTIAKYDPVSDDPDDDFSWYNVATVDRPMQLRPYIRKLLAQGYSEVSISIVQHAPPPRKARKARKEAAKS